MAHVRTDSFQAGRNSPIGGKGRGVETGEMHLGGATQKALRPGVLGSSHGTVQDRRGGDGGEPRPDTLFRGVGRRYLRSYLDDYIPKQPAFRQSADVMGFLRRVEKRDVVYRSGRG